MEERRKDVVTMEEGTMLADSNSGLTEPMIPGVHGTIQMRNGHCTI